MNYQSLLRIFAGPALALVLSSAVWAAEEKKESDVIAEAEAVAAAASWKESATSPGDPLPAKSEGESKPESTAKADKPKAEKEEKPPQGDREVAKAQKAAEKKAAAEVKAAQKKAEDEQKIARKAAREKALADIKAARERAKARKADEKNLSKEEREDWAIREAALRYMLSAEPPGEVVFISFTPLDSVKMRWNDPPEGFLNRLTDLTVQLRPATQAILTREPVADPERPNRMVQDPVTKNAASIYWSEVLKDSKAGETRVDAGCFRGFLKSWGCILIMKKVRGTWQVSAQTAVWKT